MFSRLLDGGLGEIASRVQSIADTVINDTDEIKQLEMHNQKLTQELQRLDKLVTEKQLRIDQLEADGGYQPSLTDGTGDLSPELARIQQENQKLAAERSQLSMQINQLQSQLKALSTGRDMHQIASHDGPSHSGFKELDNAEEFYQKKLDAAHAKIEELEHRLASISSGDSSPTRANAKVQQLEQQKVALEAYFNKKMQEQKDSFRKKCSELEAKNQEIATQLSQFKVRAADKIKKLMSEKDELAKLANSGNTADRQAAEESASSRLSELEALSSEQQIIIDEKELEIQQLKDKMTEFEDASELKAELANLQRSTAFEIERLSSMLQAEETKSKDFRAKLEKLEANHTADVARINKLASEEKAKLLAKNNELDAIISQLKQAANSTDVYADSISPKDKNASPTADARGELLAQQDKKRISEELELPRTRIADLEAALEHARRQLDDSRSEAATELQQLNTKVLELEEQKRDLERKLEESNDMNQNEIQQLADSLKAKAQADAKKLQAKLSELEKLLKDSESKKHALGVTIQSLEASILEKDRTLAMINEHVSSLEASGQNNTEISGLDSIAIQKILDSIINQSDVADSDYAKLDDLTSSLLQELAVKVGDLKRELEELQRKSVHAEQAASAEQSGLFETMNALRQDNAHLAKELANIQSSHEEQTRNLAMLTTENQNLNGEKSHLIAQIKSIQRFFEPELAVANQEIERLKSALADSESRRKQLQSELDALQTHDTDALDEAKSEKVVELERQVEKQKAELDRLRQFLIEVEENQTRDAISFESSAAEYRQQVTYLENAREELQLVVEQEQREKLDFEEQLRECKEELNSAWMKANEFKMKLDQESSSLQNLQMVLEQFQSAKERDVAEAVQSIKKMYEEASAAALEWEERAKKAEAEISSVKKDSPRRMSLEKDYEAKEILIGKLRHDVIQLQSHLSEAMKKMRNNSAEDNVDRKLLSNLVIGFITAPRGTSKPFEILNIIANTLQFTNDERVRVGLMRPSAVATSQTASRRLSESFTDMWVSYLENEANVKSPTAPQQERAEALQKEEGEKKEPEPPTEHASIFARLLGV